MKQQKIKYEEIEQYDYSDGGYLEKVFEKYSLLIGSFLIKFSVLEDELNLAIADFVSDRAHELGFVVIEKLTTSNKIELFYKMYNRLESFKDKKSKDKLNKIKTNIEAINSFRNNIVHANWQSLTKDGLVRTKIMVDNDEGYVKFKKTQISPKIIRQKIKEIDKLIDQIFRYKEKVFQL